MQGRPGKNSFPGAKPALLTVRITSLGAVNQGPSNADGLKLHQMFPDDHPIGHDSKNRGMGR